MNIRDRIIELRRVRASELTPNPKNWRTHPQEQQDALRGVLAEVGYVDALLARELEDGSLMLIDGHLRAETTPDEDVPVLILDVTEDEADKILLTFDPLSAMADFDAMQLDGLLQEVETDSEALADLMDSLRSGAGLDGDSPDFEDVVQESEERSLGDPNSQIKIVLYSDGVELLEDAIDATGLKNRGDAIKEICEAYVEKNGQWQPERKTVNADEVHQRAGPAASSD